MSVSASSEPVKCDGKVEWPEKKTREVILEVCKRLKAGIQQTKVGLDARNERIHAILQTLPQDAGVETAAAVSGNLLSAEQDLNCMREIARETHAMLADLLQHLPQRPIHNASSPA